jgi:predicted GNAT superfamily acetyltransferase
MLHFELLKSYENITHFNMLTRRIWGTNASDDIPVHVLVTMAKNGGGVLVARADDGPPDLDRMVGMALWWPGLQVPRHSDRPLLKICSHMAGVLPQWQGQGVGRQLKLKQREVVLAQGLTEWVTWTYDPLYRSNGIFNLHRLGAVCNTYARNVYGELDDDLNRGTPSDRCQVDWWLRSERVARVAQNQLPNGDTDWHGSYILPSLRNAAGFLCPVDKAITLEAAAIAVPVPEDIGAIRRADPALGHDWRMYMRGVFEAAFASGYQAVDCVRLREHGWHYILVNEIK